MPKPNPSFEERALLSAVGNRVRDLRADRGWTQEDLVERADIDRSYLADLERGVTNPSLLILARVAKGLGIDLATLFAEDGRG